jgi:hypothetical protein
MVDARQTIVEGAVGIVQSAIAKLAESGTEFEADDRTKLTINLLTVICGESEFCRSFCFRWHNLGRDDPFDTLIRPAFCHLPVCMRFHAALVLLQARRSPRSPSARAGEPADAARAALFLFAFVYPNKQKLYHKK